MNGGPITILPIMTTKHVSLTFFLINKRVIVIIGIFTHLCACLLKSSGAATTINASSRWLGRRHDALV